jgi:hypothetical protein
MLELRGERTVGPDRGVELIEGRSTSGLCASTLK